jgi:hypothetical protein
MIQQHKNSILLFGKIHFHLFSCLFIEINLSSDLFSANISYSVYLPPESRMIYDYMIDLNTFVYHEWDSLVPKTEQLIKTEQTQLVIPTVDIVRYSFLLTAVLIHKKPVLLTGRDCQIE